MVSLLLLSKMVKHKYSLRIGIQTYTKVAFCIFFCTTFSACSQNNSQSSVTQHDSISDSPKLRSMEPVQVQQPTVTEYTGEIDESKLFLVKVTSDSLLLTLNRKNSAIEVNQLADFIQKNKITNTSYEIIVIVSKTVPYNRVEAIVNVFKDEKIFKLNLLTKD